MENNEIKEPKERILEAAARLFAVKGYSAIGVREIAAAADVNISMISYYFGGKIGVLKALIEKYYTMMLEIQMETLLGGCTKEESVRSFIKKFVDMIRDNEALCKVVINEFTIDVPEIESFKIEMLKKHIDFLKSSFKEPAKHPSNPKYHTIMGPAMMGLAYSNFMTGHLSNKIANVDYDDEFYDFYAETIADLFLYGVTGIIKKEMKKMNLEYKSLEELI